MKFRILPETKSTQVYVTGFASAFLGTLIAGLWLFGVLPMVQEQKMHAMLYNPQYDEVSDKYVCPTFDGDPRVCNLAELIQYTIVVFVFLSIIGGIYVMAAFTMPFAIFNTWLAHSLEKNGRLKSRSEVAIWFALLTLYVAALVFLLWANFS